MEFDLTLNVTNEKRMRAVYLEMLSNILATVTNTYDPASGKFPTLAAAPPCTHLPPSKQEMARTLPNKPYRPIWSLSRVLAVITCESQWNVRAIGDGGESYGLVQIYMPLCGTIISVEDAIDPYLAIDFLVSKMSEGQGELWTCFSRTAERGGRSYVVRPAST